MQVRALSAGFFGGARRRLDEVFEVPDGTKAKWFAPVGESKAAPAAKPGKQEPKALSQMGKEQSKSFTDVLKGEEKAAGLV